MIDLGAPIEILERISVGMVYDLYTEKANDAEQYPYKATKEDYDAFFGGK